MGYRYMSADDVNDLHLDLDIRQTIADYINNVVEQAQADAWEEGFKKGKTDKSDFNIDYLNPYK